MKDVKNRIVFSLAVSVIVLAGVLSAPARADDGLITEPVIRGEQARLLRQAYDYAHRNSNNNVYRNSRHFHPTRNVFRSSRHYKQRVAASSDGYPLRTFIRFGRSVDGPNPKLIEYSYAHHRRSPFGLPSIEEPGLEALLFDGGRAYDRSPFATCSSRRGWVHYGSHHEGDVAGSRTAPPPEHAPHYQVITPEGTVTNPSNDSGNEQSAREAVLRTVRDDDGSLRTVITNLQSRPKSTATMDDAWNALAEGDTARSEQLFQAHVMDELHGPEAMVGHGLARLMQGDEDAARTAFERAQRLDADVLQRIRLSSMLRSRLRALPEEGVEGANAEVLAQLTK